MRTVHKYPVRFCQSRISMPEGAEIIRFSAQRNELCIWAVVDTTKPEKNRHFEVVGTGHEIGFEYNKYVGSCDQGPYIWHLFENTLSN
jgi:hypothetical protein